MGGSICFWPLFRQSQNKHYSIWGLYWVHVRQDGGKEAEASGLLIPMELAGWV